MIENGLFDNGIEDVTVCKFAGIQGEVSIITKSFEDAQKLKIKIFNSFIKYDPLTNTQGNITDETRLKERNETNSI